jgi:hypothetical protein
VRVFGADVSQSSNLLALVSNAQRPSAPGIFATFVLEGALVADLQARLAGVISCRTGHARTAVSKKGMAYISTIPEAMLAWTGLPLPCDKEKQLLEMYSHLKMLGT